MAENLPDPSDDSQALNVPPPRTPLADYLRWTSTIHASPPIYHLAANLSFCAYTLCRRGFRIETIFSTTHPALQFVMLGDSGAGKSTAIALVRDFADDVWREADLTFPNPRVQPAGSIPGILGTLQTFYNRKYNITPAWLIHDEVAQLFNSREPVAELLCQLSDGRTIEHRTKTAQRQRQNSAELELLENPRIAGLFASTEAQLAPHFKEAHRSGGVFARMLWVRPPIGPEHDHQKAITPAFLETSRKHRQAAVDAFASWEAELTMIDQNDGQTFRFNDPAEQRLFEFREELKQQNVEDDGLQGQRRRASDRARIVGAILASQCGRLQVELRDIERAIGLLEIFLRYAETTLNSKVLAGDQLERLCTRVEGVVLRAGDKGIRRGKIYRQVRLSKDLLDRVLDTLKDRELVFNDTRNPEEPGVLIHAQMPAGARLREHLKKRAAANAAMRELDHERKLN